MLYIAHLFILFRERDFPLEILIVYNEWMWIVWFLPLSNDRPGTLCTDHWLRWPLRTRQVLSFPSEGSSDGGNGFRMLWCRVYRPRARQRSAWDHLCRPRTPLILTLPLPGSLPACGERPSVSFGVLAARCFHCAFPSDLTARSHFRTPSVNTPTLCLLPCAILLSH